MIMEIKKTNKVKHKGITIAQYELYKMMKLKHDTGTQFTKIDLLNVYNKFVVSKQKLKSVRHNYDLTEDQVYNNASGWMNNSISVLVRKGYFGLTFKKPVESLEIKEIVNCPICPRFK
jgi:hypothetical protein